MSLADDMRDVLDYARANGLSAAELLSAEWSSRNVRCGCGAVHYDMNPEAAWTCSGCDARHCPLTTTVCALCGCIGYAVGGGCSNCYCHDEYPGGCAICGMTH